MVRYAGSSQSSSIIIWRESPKESIEIENVSLRKILRDHGANRHCVDLPFYLS